MAETRTEFEDRMEKRISDLSRRIIYLEKTQHVEKPEQLQIRDTLDDLIWKLTYDVDLRAVQMQRRVPMRIFFGDPVPEEFMRDDLLSDLGHILKEAGLYFDYLLPEEKGSWWQKIYLVTGEILTKDEVQKRLDLIEAALKTAYLDKPQAEANQTQADAAAKLISALQNVPNACIQVGTLLLVKVTRQDGTCTVAVRTLTATELKRLEENQSALRRPEEILEMLGESSRPQPQLLEQQPR